MQWRAGNALSGTLGIGGITQYYLDFNVNPSNYSGNGCHVQGPAPSANTWYFIALSYTASSKTCRLEINNSLSYTNTGSYIMPADPTYGIYFNFQYDNTASYDEWGFWKGRILTTQEKTDLYNSGSGRTFPF